MHYKECISLNAIVCPECNVPIPTIFKERYIIHYSTNHPEIEDPYAEIAKFKIHSTEESLCPLKTCDFRAKDGQIIRDHWHEAHNHLRFPEVRGISVNHEDVSFFLGFGAIFSSGHHFQLVLISASRFSTIIS